MSVKKRIFIDMDGTLARWGSILSIDELYEKGYYFNLEPHKKMIETVKKLVKMQKEDNSFEVKILTCYLHDSHYAKNEKEMWLQKYLPELKEDDIIFVPYGEEKTNYIDKLDKNCFLIDDYTKNLKEWESRGGTGIKVYNGINSRKGTWRGQGIYVHKNYNSTVILGIIDDELFRKPVLKIAKANDFIIQKAEDKYVAYFPKMGQSFSFSSLKTICEYAVESIKEEFKNTGHFLIDEKYLQMVGKGDDIDSLKKEVKLKLENELNKENKKELKKEIKKNIKKDIKKDITDDLY